MTSEQLNLWRLRRKKEEKKVEEENELSVTSLLLYVSRSWA
jgi:hypothetical protein